MFNNGNNNGGNPNHASDGKFTSGPNQAGNGGNKVEKKENYESQIKEKLGIKNDADQSYEEKIQNVMGIKKAEMPKKKFLISDSEGSLISEEPIEASSEEEAFEIASQMFPGRGDELFVNEDAAENNADVFSDKNSSDDFRNNLFKEMQGVDKGLNVWQASDYGMGSPNEFYIQDDNEGEVVVPQQNVLSKLNEIGEKYGYKVKFSKENDFYDHNRPNGDAVMYKAIFVKDNGGN